MVGDDGGQRLWEGKTRMEERLPSVKDRGDKKAREDGRGGRRDGGGEKEGVSEDGKKLQGKGEAEKKEVWKSVGGGTGRAEAMGFLHCGCHGTGTWRRRWRPLRRGRMSPLGLGLRRWVGRKERRGVGLVGG
jgi:hypothetical protein